MTKGDLPKVDAERYLLKKAVLTGNGLQLAAEITAVDQGSVDVKYVVEEIQLKAAYVKEMTGWRVVGPGLCVGPDVEEEAEGEPFGDDLWRKGTLEIGGSHPVIRSALEILKEVGAELEVAVAHHDLLAGETVIVVAADKIIVVGIVFAAPDCGQLWFEFRQVLGGIARSEIAEFGAEQANVETAGRRIIEEIVKIQVDALERSGLLHLQVDRPGIKHATVPDSEGQLVEIAEIIFPGDGIIQGVGGFQDIVRKAAFADQIGFCFE